MLSGTLIQAMILSSSIYLLVYFILKETLTLISYTLFLSSPLQAARNNVLLAVPAFLYAINNYLKFIMQVFTLVESVTDILGPL